MLFLNISNTSRTYHTHQFLLDFEITANYFNKSISMIDIACTVQSIQNFGMRLKNWLNSKYAPAYTNQNTRTPHLIYISENAHERDVDISIATAVTITKQGWHSTANPPYDASFLAAPKCACSSLASSRCTESTTFDEAYHGFNSASILHWTMPKSISFDL